MPHYHDWTNRHTFLGAGRMLNQQLTRLANSGPAGMNQATRLIQDLAKTSSGMSLLKHAFQHNQTNLEFARARAKSTYSLRTSGGNATLLFGDGKTGKRLPSGSARTIAASYRHGAGSK